MKIAIATVFTISVLGTFSGINTPVHAGKYDEVCGCQYPLSKLPASTNCEDGLGRKWTGTVWTGRGDSVVYSESPYTGKACTDISGARKFFWGSTEQEVLGDLAKLLVKATSSFPSDSSISPEKSNNPSLSTNTNSAIIFTDPSIASNLKANYMIVSGPRFSSDEFELQNDLHMIRHFKTTQAFAMSEEDGSPLSFKVMVRTPSSNKVTIYGICQGNGTKSKLVAWDNSWKNSDGSTQELREATILGLSEVFNSQSSKCPGTLESRAYQAIDEQLDAGTNM